MELPDRSPAMNLRIGLVALCLITATATAPVGARIRNVTDADAPRSLPAEGTVSVSWQDPAQFTEILHSSNRTEARRGDWVLQLAMHLRERAQKRLPPGERMEVDILDIQRAGNYEPSRATAYSDVRVVRELYPPRMTLAFKRIGADGQVIAEGERKLSDPGYLIGPVPGLSSDPLRYEKSLIDRWLAQEFEVPEA